MPLGLMRSKKPTQYIKKTMTNSEELDKNTELNFAKTVSKPKD